IGGRPPGSSARGRKPPRSPPPRRGGGGGRGAGRPSPPPGRGGGGARGDTPPPRRGDRRPTTTRRRGWSGAGERCVGRGGGGGSGHGLDGVGGSRSARLGPGRQPLRPAPGRPRRRLGGAGSGVEAQRLRTCPCSFRGYTGASDCPPTGRTDSCGGTVQLAPR